MDYTITTECRDCEGSGQTTWGNPIDPSARFSKCDECYGSGMINYTETYESLKEAQADYPDALSIRRKK
jgi:DnaJ-class molecular chaperone